MLGRCQIVPSLASYMLASVLLLVALSLRQKTTLSRLMRFVGTLRFRCADNMCFITPIGFSHDVVVSSRLL